MLAARAGLVPGLPLMHPAFYIRPARVEEAAALSDLCFRSKAVWGYDPEFMALMLAALGVAGEDIAAGDVWVATGADRQIAGVVALAPGDAPGALDLNKLFIEPRHIRSGVGRALLAHAIAEARRRGAGRLTILADPNAAGFYERNGAVRIGEAPSDAVPGRLLRDIRFYAAVKSRPARDSLIRRKNSLMARINSLQGRIKFPVPMRRELGRKSLNSAIDFEPIVALGGLDEQNSLYFPS
jgi:GNAT superfamily N-acetyltransferase